MATPTMDRAERRSRPRYARLGLLGLGLATMALTLIVAVVLMRFPDEAGFFLPVLLVVAAATAVVWRFDATWAYVAGAVVALGLGVMMFWLAFGLLYPTSFFDFVPGVLFVLGVGLAVFGNIAAIVQRRRQHLDARASPAERRTMQVVTGIVVLAVVVSGALSMLIRPTVDDAAAAGAVPVTMTGFAFEPGTIEVDGGGSLLVHNDDPLVHDVAVPAMELEAVDVTPGGSVLIDVPDAPGTYVLYCTLHSLVSDSAPDADEQMVATLSVR